jgi:branched-chain amino acid transport system permease protein
VYAGLAFVIVYFWITRRILSSRFGLELRSVRDDETAAAAAGVRVFRTKLLGFIVSAVLTSLAGTLYVQVYQAIDPETAFGLSQAIQLQLPALLGGIGTAWGPVIGGALMILLSEGTNFVSSKLNITGGDILVYGFLLLIVVLRAPNGVVGLIPKLRQGESHE